MKTQPSTVHLKDYLPPTHKIPKINLHFDLYEDHTIVTSELTIEPPLASAPLILDGEDLELITINCNGSNLSSADYTQEPTRLIIHQPPKQKFSLKIVTKIHPESNQSFSGLYKTKKIFCTQMEAQGFRRVTYFLDRPDVLSTYTTTIYADKKKYPHLLSNGDCTKTFDVNPQRHGATWSDPFPKPCYLFALVAGDLAKISDHYTTLSGRKVNLEIYTDKGNEGRCHHAMQSLKEAMEWDEKVYACEYDLNVYMIVAVDDFNMGAMENKGLNIFNSKYVLADPISATDHEFSGIQGVIGHEYFHNWSGNRITCRDWFQLSLKEGLTVFRDEEFSADLNSRAVKRIDDVNLLRTRQFPEDASGMAHPIRPESYVAIDNFYTATVYIKGAAVIRMLQTLLGRETFIQGVKNYFKKFDGQAVTTDDFLQVFADLTGRDLSLFKRWYYQAGTPKVFVQTDYNESSKQFTLTFEQKTLDPVQKTQNQPYLIPIEIGLLSEDGTPLPLKINQKEASLSMVLELDQSKKSFVFENVPKRPIPSLLRDFSAPIQLHHQATEADLQVLMMNDSDSFNRWEASQKLFQKIIFDNIINIQNKNKLSLPTGFVHAFESNLKNYKKFDLAFLAHLITPPSINYLIQFLETFDLVSLEQSYRFVLEQLYKSVSETFQTLLYSLKDIPANTSATAVQSRSLKGALLAYFSSSATPETLQWLEKCYFNAPTMTEAISALNVLCQYESEPTLRALNDFKTKWHQDSLVINKWFAVQATSWRSNIFKNILELENDSLFDKTNPNKIYSLHMAFASSNPFRFHENYTQTYSWLTDSIIEIDSRNPQVAARLATSFNDWLKWSPQLQIETEKQLTRLKAETKISKNVYEIAERALKMKS